MSAKKTVSKKAAPVKKAPAKKAPAKKAPAKKAAEKKAPVKKAAPAKKIAGPKKKPATQKQPAKAKAVPEKKTPAKAAPKKKGTDKKKITPPVKSGTVKPKNGPKRVPEKPVKPVKPVSSKPVIQTRQDHPKTDLRAKPAVDDNSRKNEVKDGVKAASKAEEPEIILSVLLEGGKTLLKTPFFIEVDEQEDRTNKKKVSSELKGLEKPTLVMRRKASLAEETPEELYNRVIQELEEENQNLYKESENQLCTKCGLRPVVAEYRVDKDLGYCEECAKMLGLGHTKEARRLDYQMNLMGGDSLSEGDDELADAAPTAEDLADPDLDIDDGKDL
jgi:hypothetical protein